jgi:hypothetical protein
LGQYKEPFLPSSYLEAKDMEREWNILERKIKTVFCGLLVVLLGLGALVPTVMTDSARTLWVLETADNSGSVGYHSSIALDNNNYPHISHNDWLNKDLKYVYRDNDGWHRVTVDADNALEATSLALDSNGYPHISYYQWGTQFNLRYAYMDSGGWYKTTVDSTGDIGRDSSLALDSNDYPHISYRDSTNSDLKYAYKDSGGWHTVTLVSSISIAWGTSIALDSNDNPHISYYDNTNTDLKYAYKDSGGWHFETADTTGGRGSSIALDSNDNPHISYGDSANLEYAYKDSGGWHTEIVDSAGVYLTSLTLDSSNNPHIGYYDSGNKNLKYAYKDSGGWNKVTVDSGGDVGFQPSLALDSNNYPHISYEDHTNTALKYACMDLPPAIATVNAQPDPQNKGGFVNITCDVTDNLGVNLVMVNITYPDASSVNVTMSSGSYYYNVTYEQVGTYTYCIWAKDRMGLTNISAVYQFEILPPTADYILISYLSKNEILDSTISTNFTLDCYASAFNTTWGFLGFVNATWGTDTTGSNASINSLFGASVELFSGWHDGIVTLTADDGNGNIDTVTFTVDSSVFCKLLCAGWNLVGWSPFVATTAESLGQSIPGSSIVLMLDGTTQTFIAHVVGVPWNNFAIEQYMGVMVYTTTSSIWHGAG